MPANDPISGENSKDDDLRKWLTGEQDSLLSWLSEGEVENDQVEADAFASVEDALSEDAEELREKADRFEKELMDLKGVITTELQKRSPDIQVINEKALGAKLKEIFDSNAQLRSEVERLINLNEELRKEFDGATSSMPKDQMALLKRQIELKERESLLLSKERELSNKKLMPNGEGSGTGSVSELEERFQAELRDKETEFRDKEKDYRSKIDYLAEELKRKSIEDQQKGDELRLAKMSTSDATKEVEQKLRDVQLKEKRMALMEEELARLKIEIRERDDELKKIREVVGYKEQELMRREEDLDYREKLMNGERRKIDEAKRETVGLDETEYKKRLEDLKSEISRKEEELISKEKFLNAKSEDLRLREQGVIEDEITKREEERAIEFTVAKVKTGNSRFDDLLLGGIPFGSNVLIHGPPFIGKEVMIAQFVGEGLKKGIPAIWVITDKTPKDIRDEMNQIVSGYEEYERLGLVRYIDSYSRAMGESTSDPYAIYIDEPTDHEKIMESTEKVAREFKEKHKYYRLAFRSLSTLIAYSDPNTAFRFLSPFCGRRKRDGAVSMYTIEKGMHGEQEIQMLGSIMDGMVDFKLDQLKSFFSVQGISDVQSRTYIRYTVGKHGLSIGSFSLDHIR
jgi:KaiC/GvpD/RAD55 family RecA-like ATPase